MSKLDTFDLENDEVTTSNASHNFPKLPFENVLDYGVRIISEHSNKLQSVEDMLNRKLVPISDEEANPIGLHILPVERVEVLDLIQTDNDLFNKIMTVLAVLCDEVSELESTARDTFYPALAMYGQSKPGVEDDIMLGDVKAENAIGTILPLLQEVSNMVRFCGDISINIIHQLASLYHTRTKLYQSTYKHVHLQPVWEALSSLFCILITLDTIILDNYQLEQSWVRYKKLMRYARSGQVKFDVDEAKMKQFEQLLVHLDNTVLTGGCFKTILELDFSQPLRFHLHSNTTSYNVEISSNPVFLAEFDYIIRSTFESLMASINGSTETNDRQRFVGTFGLYACYCRLLPRNQMPDTKFFKILWASQTQIPLVNLFGKSAWLGGEFLQNHAPLKISKLKPSDLPSFRVEYVKNMDETFPKDIQVYYLQVCNWMSEAETHLHAFPLPSDPIKLKDTLTSRARIIQSGLLLGYSISNLLKTFMTMHLNLAIPLKRSSISPLCRCIEMLKAIEGVLLRKIPILSTSYVLILQKFSGALLNILRPIKTKMESTKKLDEIKLDVLAAMHTIDKVLNLSDSFSYTRRMIIQLSLSVLKIKGVTNADEVEKINLAMWNLTLLSDFKAKLRTITDCSFLYWNPELFSAFLKDVYRHPEQAHRLQYIVSAFADPVRLFKSIQHDPSADNLYLSSYTSFIDDVVKEEIINPLCRDIDKDLRLHQHSVHLDHMAAPNPNDPQSTLQGKGRFLELAPIRTLKGVINIRKFVESYLDKTFYNLTTVSLHDWKTYGEMRNLAAEKFGLSLTENHLPMGSLDQGLDILQIMRNIHIFVSRYNYNLNQQVFVERKADRGAKHLNTINIHSIANSIRTHGTGIMNTTINFTYQFLAQKFYVFSQFLFDEYIKSYLSREKRWFERNKAENDNKYPLARAEAFIKDIRTLGVTEEGLSFLDKFRMLITEIGNALGYVRMVRSAGLHYYSNAIGFIPDLRKIISFEAHIGNGVSSNTSSSPTTGTEGVEGNQIPEPTAIAGANLSPESVMAAKTLDSVIKEMSKNVSEGTQYFRILVTVFQEVMLTPENEHLNNFFMIVPALAMNFTDSLRLAKDRVDKAAKGKEVYFCDDGFAIGTAYILAILNQESNFDSLHWFETMEKKFSGDRKEVTDMKGTDDETVQQVRFAKSRLDASEIETNMLKFSLNGAKVFFRED